MFEANTHFHSLSCCALSFKCEYRPAVVGGISLSFFFFLGMYSQHMEFPGLAVKLELQLLPYAIARSEPHLSSMWQLATTADP